MSQGWKPNWPRPRGVLRAYDPHHQLRWVRAEGPWLWDESGRRFVDFVSGYSANVLGHCHPRLTAALAEQSRSLAFTTVGESPLREELEGRLGEMVDGFFPEKSHQAWLCSTGARAVELAWKIAFATRPGQLVAFDLGYHGRSIATSYLSDTSRIDCLRRGEDSNFVERIPFPRGSNGSSLARACQNSLNRANELFGMKSNLLSALLIEPAIGSRGYYFAPQEYFQELVRLARGHGILVISDEIQMGLGRLGGLLASSKQGWRPDLIAIGKALGGGLLPVAAVLGDKHLVDQIGPGIESETFGGNPLASRIGLEVLSILQKSEIIEQSAMVHEMLRDRLRTALGEEFVDGQGSASVIDFETEERQHRCAIDCALRMTQHLQDRGILVHLTGPNRDRIALIPPLNVPQEIVFEVVNQIVDIWRETCEPIV